MHGIDQLTGKWTPVTSGLEKLQPNAPPSSYSRNDGNSAYRSDSACGVVRLERLILLRAHSGIDLSCGLPRGAEHCASDPRRSGGALRSLRPSDLVQMRTSFVEAEPRKNQNNLFLRHNNSHKFQGVTGGVAQSLPRTPPTKWDKTNYLSQRCQQTHAWKSSSPSAYPGPDPSLRAVPLPFHHDRSRSFQ